MCCRVHFCVLTSLKHNVGEWWGVSVVYCIMFVSSMRSQSGILCMFLYFSMMVWFVLVSMRYGGFELWPYYNVLLSHLIRFFCISSPISSLSEEAIFFLGGGAIVVFQCSWDQQLCRPLSVPIRRNPCETFCSSDMLRKEKVDQGVGRFLLREILWWLCLFIDLWPSEMSGLSAVTRVTFSTLTLG